MSEAPILREEPLVKIRHVRKSFSGTEVLRDINLDVHRGEVFCLLGASGAGKSTLLRAINRLETVDGGEIWVDGMRIGYGAHRDGVRALSEREMAGQRRHIGMVFQRFNLFGHMTALENVAEAPRVVLHRPAESARREAMRLLADVGLAEKAHQHPGELSGGQQQRVAIARALAMKPSLMLFDEPTSALDPELVGEVLNVMTELARGGMTMIVVTHEMSFARDVADRVAFMHHGEVVETATPDEFFTRPAHERARQFLARTDMGAAARRRPAR